MIALVTASLDDEGLNDLRHYGEVRYQPLFETRQMLGEDACYAPLMGLISSSHEVTTHQTKIIVPDIIRLIRGEEPQHVVNPEVLEEFKFRS